MFFFVDMKEVAYGSSPILADLCEAFGGVVVEGKRIRSYAFQPKLKQQIERRQLRGNSETFGDLLDGSNIQENMFDVTFIIKIKNWRSSNLISDVNLMRCTNRICCCVARLMREFFYWTTKVQKELGHLTKLRGLK